MSDPRNPSFIVQVTTPVWVRSPFCAGLVFEGPRCVEAAPILKWAVGKLWADVERCCKRQRWTLHVQRL